VKTEKRQCAKCRSEIPQGRIEAMPDTRVCVACSQAMGGSEFTLKVQTVESRKEGSLKKGTGTFVEGVERIRKPLR